MEMLSPNTRNAGPKESCLDPLGRSTCPLTLLSGKQGDISKATLPTEEPAAAE